MSPVQKYIFRRERIPIKTNASCAYKQLLRDGNSIHQSVTSGLSSQLSDARTLVSSALAQVSEWFVPAFYIFPVFTLPLLTIHHSAYL